MKLLLSIIASLLFLTTQAQEVPQSIYDFKLPGLKGNTIDLSQFKGKKILIVNTPIDADNAWQYSELERLYQQYIGKLVIIGVLAPDFAIEPGSKKSNMGRGEKNYNVTFPLTTKLLVRTEAMAPIFKWLTEKRYNHFSDNEVKWDFQKYLINESGELVAVFDPKVKANNPQLLAAIGQ